jgi:parvulin-like peptidyl-prolyl isomerase
MIVSTMTIALVLAVAPQGNKKPAAKPSAKSAAMSSSVIARYNGVNITASDIKKQLSGTLARRVVPEMIQKIVIEQEAKKAGVSVTASELAEKVKEEKAKVVAQMAQSGKMMTFAEITREFGLTDAEVTQTVRLNLLARKSFEKFLIKIVPGREGQGRFAHILLATQPLGPTPEQATPMTPEQLKKKEEDQKVRVDQILADIKAGKLKFDEAAKQFSDDKGSGAMGGELPWVGKGVFDQDFEKAAFALQKPGDISPVIKSQFGWHIIKLLEKGSDISAAEKAKYKKEQVNAKLNEPQAVQKWLGEMARNAKIEFNPNAKLF